MKIEVKFYDRTTTQGCSDSCAEGVVSLARLSLTPRESLASKTTKRGKDGKWALCVHIHPHTHISMSGVDSRSLWGVYLWVLSDIPTECVTQCANVPSLKQNTRHHANHALSRICAWNQMWYHLHLRATLFHSYTIKQSSLKTSSYRIATSGSIISPNDFISHLCLHLCHNHHLPFYYPRFRTTAHYSVTVISPTLEPPTMTLCPHHSFGSAQSKLH